MDYVTAQELLPGDIVALEAGDTRQVVSAGFTAQNRYVAVAWSDCRPSLMDPGRSLPLLYPSPLRPAQPASPEPTQGDTE